MNRDDVVHINSSINSVTSEPALISIPCSALYPNSAWATDATTEQILSWYQRMFSLQKVLNIICVQFPLKNILLLNFPISLCCDVAIFYSFKAHQLFLFKMCETADLPVFSSTFCTLEFPCGTNMILWENFYLKLQRQQSFLSRNILWFFLLHS